MATLDCSAYLGNTASYDDVSGDLTLDMGAGLTPEKIVLKLLETIETLAQNKRSNINFPICEKQFPDLPPTSIVSRTNGTLTETQIQRIYQFVGMYVMTEPTFNNAINPND